MSANGPKTAPDYEFWLDKKTAAGILGVSTKSVEKFHADGELQAVSWRRPSGGPRIMVYHPGDVETLRAKRSYTPPTAFVMPSENSRNNSEKGEESRFDLERDSAHILRVLKAIIETAGGQNLLEPSSQKVADKPSRAHVEIKDRVYLTIAEASMYMGKPQRKIRDLIASGRLAADHDGYTRVRRRDLDAL
ncbi:MAG: helix-turn-helix domain-containing protein [Ignavibacteriota bacterium]